MATDQPRQTSPRASPQQYIEDLPVEKLKLYFSHFSNSYKEYQALYELTILILQSKGLLLKGLTLGSNPLGHTRSDEVEEQQMDDPDFQTGMDTELNFNDVSDNMSPSPRAHAGPTDLKPRTPSKVVGARAAYESEEGFQQTVGEHIREAS